MFLGSGLAFGLDYALGLLLAWTLSCLDFGLENVLDFFGVDSALAYGLVLCLILWLGLGMAVEQSRLSVNYAQLHRNSFCVGKASSEQVYEHGRWQRKRSGEKIDVVY